jgi:hypothetical protein
MLTPIVTRQDKTLRNAEFRLRHSIDPIHEQIIPQHVQILRKFEHIIVKMRKFT